MFWAGDSVFSVDLKLGQAEESAPHILTACGHLTRYFRLQLRMDSAVILALAIYSADPTIGIWALIAAILVWFWPIWPLLAILAVVVAAIAMAAGRTAPQMGSKR